MLPPDAMAMPRTLALSASDGCKTASPRGGSPPASAGKLAVIEPANSLWTIVISFFESGTEKHTASSYDHGG